jgi:DNA mismatch endonuclease (patch repair protein)
MQRRRTMAGVHSEDTTPERIVRRLLHGLGLRFRLHRRELPGAPDIVLPGRKTVIFVHGCFWHQHACPRGARRPATNAGYWRRKLDRNQARDQVVRRRLQRLGWRVLVVWECQTHRRKLPALARRLRGRLLDASTCPKD